MFSNLLENPKLFRHVVEDLPVGIYIVDRDLRIRFWNRGAEHLTGHLAHEVVGHDMEEVVQSCNRRGNELSGEHCPVAMTLSLGQAQQCTASYLHKNGHRVPVTIRTRPIVEYGGEYGDHGDEHSGEHGDVIGGVTVLFEEAFASREESLGPTMYGCLDGITGIPSRRLTRAVLNECLADVDKSHLGFGVLRIRLLGIKDFQAKHGRQSAVPFLRAAAHTLRNSLNEENFLGCWEEHEFLAVLPSASPVTVATTAETLWNLLRHSEVSWWGDRFLVDAEVAYTVATGGGDLDSLLRKMKAAHAGGKAKAASAGTAKDSRNSRG
jgi:PAS domain S-box-containing protein